MGGIRVILLVGTFLLTGLLGLTAASHGTAAQAEKGSVAAGPYVPDPATGDGPFLAGVCFELVGAGYSATECSNEVQQSSALFPRLPFGAYTLSLVSATAGCAAPDLPVAVEVASTERVYVNVAMACEMTTVTVHVAECAEGLGAESYAACHENRLAGINLLIETDVRTTDANGIAMALVTAGPTTLREFPVSAGYVGVNGYCSDLSIGVALLNGSATEGFSFEAPAGGEVVCDLYNLIPAGGGGDSGGDTSSGDTPDGDVITGTITLPNTGAGAAAARPSHLGWVLAVLVLAVTLGAASVRARRLSPLSFLAAS